MQTVSKGETCGIAAQVWADFNFESRYFEDIRKQLGWQYMCCRVEYWYRVLQKYLNFIPILVQSTVEVLELYSNTGTEYCRSI